MHPLLRPDKERKRSKHYNANAGVTASVEWDQKRRGRNLVGFTECRTTASGRRGQAGDITGRENIVLAASLSKRKQQKEVAAITIGVRRERGGKSIPACPLF